MATGMHICPSCSSRLVQPVRWFERFGGVWHVQLRCPECEWSGEGTYGQTDVERYDEELDAGAHLVLDGLRRLTTANMEAEVERFTEALAVGAILPEDF